MSSSQFNHGIARAAGASTTAGKPDANATQAIIAGAVGRLGEALLNAVLARGGYGEVTVLADREVKLGHRGLLAKPLAEVAGARDLFFLTMGEGVTGGRSFHGRDAPFVQMDIEHVEALLRAIPRLGVRRVVLIAPAPIWEQFGHIHRGLGSPLEVALGGMALDRLVVLRPLRAASSPGGSFMQRFVHAYLSVQMLMMPRSIPTLTSEQIARAALAVLVPQHDGVSVLPAGEIAQLLGGRSASSERRASG